MLKYRKPLITAAKIVLAIVCNVLLFAVLQIISVFVHFGLFGSGAFGDKYIIHVALVFAVMQILAVVVAYRYKWVVKDLYIVVISAVLVAGLYLNFMYLPDGVPRGA